MADSRGSGFGRSAISAFGNFAFTSAGETLAFDVSAFKKAGAWITGSRGDSYANADLLTGLALESGFARMTGRSESAAARRCGAALFPPVSRIVLPVIIDCHWMGGIGSFAAGCR